MKPSEAFEEYCEEERGERDICDDAAVGIDITTCEECFSQWVDKHCTLKKQKRSKP